MAATVVTPTESLYASFADAALAEKAAGALMDHGVRAEDLSIISNKRDDNARTDERDYSADEARVADGQLYMDTDDDEKYQDPTDRAAKSGISTTTPGDAASGAAKGAGIGFGAGVAAALASIFVPGFGLVAGGGALATAIAGAAGATAAGAAAGGVHGYLKDQGVPDEPARRYEEAFKNGSAVLSVQAPSNNVDAATIEEVLVKYGGGDIGAYGPTGETSFAQAA